MQKRFAACVISTVLLSTIIIAQQPVVRTADPIKRGMQLSDFPRTVKVADNVYTYEDFHAGPEKFTTTNMFVVTSDGVLVADGQGSVPETKGLVDAITTVVIGLGVTFLIASTSNFVSAGLPWPSATRTPSLVTTNMLVVVNLSRPAWKSS